MKENCLNDDEKNIFEELKEYLENNKPLIKFSLNDDEKIVFEEIKQCLEANKILKIF